ncbi:MAG: transketolase C-terminal domain-containing protein, partial [Desulfurobacteriaceae bacterium]
SWEVLREGKEVAVVATGWTVYQALLAAQELEKNGISVTVVNGRFVKPIDERLLSEIARNHPIIITVEENAIKGGFGSAVDEFLSSWFTGKVINVGIPDRFIEHGNQDLLRRIVGIDAEGIKRAVLDAVRKTVR